MKAHGWFNAIKWSDLCSQKIIPHFKPFAKMPTTDETLCQQALLRESETNEYEEEFKEFIQF